MCRTWRSHLLKLFDDFFIFVQIRLVCSVHTCNTHTQYTDEEKHKTVTEQLPLVGNLLPHKRKFEFESELQFCKALHMTK